MTKERKHTQSVQVKNLENMETDIKPPIYCRTCLASDCDLTEMNDNVLNVLTDVLSIKVNSLECPKICLKCKDFLELVITFTKRCREVQQIIASGFCKYEHDGEKPFVKDECHEEFAFEAVKTECVVKKRKKKEEIPETNALTRIECYNCDYCHERFSYKNHLRDHLSIHVEKKTYTCHFCAKPYEGLGSLTRHFNSWHAQDEPTIQCEQCSEAFYCDEQLRWHRNEVHAKPKCSECCMEFDSLRHLRLHLTKTHRKNVEATRKTRQKRGESFKCTQCARVFRDQSTHKQHMRLKHCADATIDCPVDACNNRYQAFYMLVSHMTKTHPSTPPTIPCAKCDEKFYVNAQLTKHNVRMHKEIKCTHCNKRMKNMRNLNRHINAVHAVKVPLCCAVCAKVCYTDDTYKRHMRKHACTDERQVCNYCGLKFTKLQQHVLNQHTNARARVYTCRFCAGQFTDLQTLRAHSKKAHVLERMNQVLDSQCKICGKMFLKRNLSNHMKRTHSKERPYACSVCGKTYKEKQHFNAHALLHSHQRRFACEFCDKKFATQRELRNHEDVHDTKTGETYS